jgi:Spy/CpxP family protein refolding chaperone
MRQFVVYAVVGALAVGLASAGFAQGAGPKGGVQGGAQGGAKDFQGKRPGARDGLQKMGKMRNEIFAKLNLSEAQKKQIVAIDAQAKREMMALRDAPGDRQAKMSKLQELREKHQAAVMNVLTPAQRKQHEALWNEARQKMKSDIQKKRPGAGGKKPPAKGSNPPPLN